MNLFSKHLVLAASVASTLTLASAAKAEWASLNPENSSVTYVTTKLNDISEVHQFQSLAGSVADDGSVALTISADSVFSNLELRDERMKEFLYEVATYPSIEIAAQIDVNALPEGVSSLDFPAVVTLKGRELPVNVQAFVMVSEDSVMVSSAQPVILYAATAGVADGVAKLSELAGGIAIGGSIGVTFSLSFDR